jgi:hypothetical protein
MEKMYLFLHVFVANVSSELPGLSLSSKSQVSINEVDVPMNCIWLLPVMGFFCEWLT